MGVPDVNSPIFADCKIKWGPPRLFPMCVVDGKIEFSLGE